jgi:nitrite reductase/ring-hydroxylating ferredoxin subunit
LPGGTPQCDDLAVEWYDTGIHPDAASPQPVDVRGQPILLVRVEDEWLAIEDRCSHARCAFRDDGEIDGAVAICNCHGSEFDVRSGAVLVGPAVRSLETFRTRRSGQQLEVAL